MFGMPLSTGTVQAPVGFCIKCHNCRKMAWGGGGPATTRLIVNVPAGMLSNSKMGPENHNSAKNEAA